MKYRNGTIVMGVAAIAIAVGVAGALGGPALRAITGRPTAEKVTTIRTGSADRMANMLSFAGHGLKLLEETIRSPK